MLALDVENLNVGAMGYQIRENVVNAEEKSEPAFFPKSKQQDFDNFQMGNITAPSLVNDTYEDEIYSGVNGYEDGIPYDVIFTYDASPNSYIGLPQFYADVGQQTYRNDFLDQYEIHEINFTSYSFPQVYRCDIFGPCETEYPQWYFY
ncbi:37264_t:CDS:2, partial [Gigaspora margarita]